MALIIKLFSSLTQKVYPEPNFKTRRDAATNAGTPNQSKAKEAFICQ